MKAFVRSASVAALTVLAWPSGATARDFLYPWRAGQSLEAVSADQSACIAAAKDVEAYIATAERARMRGQPAPPPPAGSQSWLSPGLDAQRGFFSAYYDCLRERGYSIRRMPSAEYGALKKGKDGGMGVLRAMVAPQSPHAEVARGTIK